MIHQCSFCIRFKMENARGICLFINKYQTHLMHGKKNDFVRYQMHSISCMYVMHLMMSCYLFFLLHPPKCMQMSTNIWIRNFWRSRCRGLLVSVWTISVRIIETLFTCSGNQFTCVLLISSFPFFVRVFSINKLVNFARKYWSICIWVIFFRSSWIWLNNAHYSRKPVNRMHELCVVSM